MLCADPRTVAATDWVVVTVRAWRDGGRQMIRLIAWGKSEKTIRVAIETSSEAAAYRLRSWLDELAGSEADRSRTDDSADEDETSE